MLKCLKITFVFAGLLLLSKTVYSQQNLFQEIEISFGVGTVKQYLDSVQKQLDTKFVYSDIIKPNKSVQIPKGIYTTSQFLDSLFLEQSLMYVTRSNFIILSPQTKKSIQQESLIISGQVISEKEKGIAFASIYIENRSLGTIANANGEFRFILPSNMAGDTLIISSIGFEAIKILPNEYLTDSLIVKLKEANITFKSIEVRPINPEYLVTKSYLSRKDNYSDIPVSMEAFFRETSKQDEDYIALTEALIEIDKSAYTSFASDVIRLVKGRSGTNVDKSDLVNLVVEGGLYNGLKLDIVKNGSYFYGEDALVNCDFDLLKSIDFKNRQTYVVGFSPKKGIDYAGYAGKLYIDRESLALVRAEFYLSKDGVKYSRNSLVKKSPRGFLVKPVFAKYFVEYRFYNNVWNLHYARSEMGIKVKKARGKQDKGFSCIFNSASEFVVTNVSDSIGSKIPYREAAKANDVLVEQVQNSNLSFWVDNNIIIPEEPLINTIQKLNFDKDVSRRKPKLN